MYLRIMNLEQIFTNEDFFKKIFLLIFYIFLKFFLYIFFASLLKLSHDLCLPDPHQTPKRMTKN